MNVKIVIRKRSEKNLEVENKKTFCQSLDYIIEIIKPLLIIIIFLITKLQRK